MLRGPYAGAVALTALILPPAAVTYAAGSGGQPVPQAWGLAANLTKSVVLAGSEAHAAAAAYHRALDRSAANRSSSCEPGYGLCR